MSWRPPRPAGLSIDLRGALPLVCSTPLALDAVFSLWRGEPVGFLGSLAALVLIWFAVGLIRRGLRRAATSEGNEGRPPLRAIGALAVGAAAWLAAWTGAGYDQLAAGAFGAAASIGVAISYGLERIALTRPPIDGAALERARAEETLAEAEAIAGNFSETARALGDAEVMRRASRIAEWVGRIATLVRDDPADLRRARRFLTVYLTRADAVLERYRASRSAGALAGALRTELLALLAELEKTASAQHRALLERENKELDVQIEALREQLRRSSVR